MIYHLFLQNGYVDFGLALVTFDELRMWCSTPYGPSSDGDIK